MVTVAYWQNHLRETSSRSIYARKCFIERLYYLIITNLQKFKLFVFKRIVVCNLTWLRQRNHMTGINVALN